MANLDPEHLPAYHSAKEILSHRRFSLARDELVKAILALFEQKPSLSRLLVEAAHTVLFSVIMCLHARYDAGDRATWPTLSLITQSTVAMGVASPSRIHDIVLRLIKTDYLEQRTAPQDGRVRILKPTNKLITQDQDFLIAHYRPLAILFPDPGYAPIMKRDLAFQLTQRLVSASLFANAAQIMARNPIMMLFLSRNGGVMVLMKLMQMFRAQADTAPLEISYSDLGNRFGVSRTHVSKLLHEAEKQKLVRLTKVGGRFVQVMPALVQAFDRFLADSMSGFDLCYNLALQAAP
jgi:DNA-binding MarR family transcriptional regulator